LERCVRGYRGAGRAKPLLSRTFELGLWHTVIPRSAMQDRSASSPVARMRAHGVRVALDGDNSVLGGEEDMLAEVRLCANLHRQPGFETAAPGAEEMLAMANVAGAHAAAARARRRDLSLPPDEQAGSPKSTSSCGLTV
jgi:hypothetical protein